MRVVALHRDALVVTSRMWQTNALLLRGARGGDRATRDGEGERTPRGGGRPEPLLGSGGELPLAGRPHPSDAPDARDYEAMLVDSPYFPDELEALRALAAQSGFAIEALLATHADFDHLLGRLAFPGLALGVAVTTADRLRTEPAAPGRELADVDAEHYVPREPALDAGDFQELPVPGRLELGGEELELHPADGHTADGMAILAPHTGVLACGDYLSDVEIPMISPGGSLDAYRDTVARLAPLVERSDHVVPGHGSPLDRDGALRVLDEDVDYLDALERGEDRAPLPPGRDSHRQRGIHAANAARLGSGGL
jgi:glyoxylase-like metal-dependent hydrolase (beta-lactamase superfamily II)